LGEIADNPFLWLGTALFQKELYASLLSQSNSSKNVHSKRKYYF
jgi:hypothetical protein